MALRLAEKRYATATIATRPSSPVYRCMAGESADHFENQLTTLGRVGRNTEGILDQLGGFIDVLFLRVVKTAEDSAGIDLLSHLHFQDDAHCRVDRVVLGVAARADHGRGLADILGIDGADIARAR